MVPFLSFVAVLGLKRAIQASTRNASTAGETFLITVSSNHLVIVLHSYYRLISIDLLTVF